MLKTQMSLAQQLTSFKGRHIRSSKELTLDDLNIILKASKYMETAHQRHALPPLLNNLILATLFFEPSTRTRLSFETAMIRLGGNVITVEQGTSSSAKKGERLSDTIQVVSQYSDVIAIRHPSSNSLQGLSSQVPLISAGDGSNEHPTQALLDLYTIYENFKDINGLKIGIIGDLRFGRTVHSLLNVLSNYSVTLYLVSHPSLGLSDEMKAELSSNNISFYETDSIEEVIAELDVLYVTRVQTERLTEPSLFDTIYQEYKDGLFNYQVNLELLNKGKPTVKVLHPLPRTDEISEDLDSDPRATYMKQAKNGIYVRMALLALVLGRIDADLLVK